MGCKHEKEGTSEYESVLDDCCPLCQEEKIAQLQAKLTKYKQVMDEIYDITSEGYIIERIDALNKDLKGE